MPHFDFYAVDSDEYPEAYNFQKVYDQNFGIVKKASFPAEIEFSGHAGIYVGERRWSPDQKVTRKKDGAIRLKLSVSSDQELIAWILSFGPDAKVIKPKWLVEAVNEKLSTMKRQYER
jgi:predicted DNA-binding transcriptional regulator YafY